MRIHLYPYLLIVTISMIICVSSLKVHKHVDQHDYIWVSEDQSQWIGYLPQCEYICTQEEKGQVCDTNPRVCCEQGQCTQKYGLTVCGVPVKNFKCDRNNHMHYQNEEFLLKEVPEMEPYLHPQDQHKKQA